MIKMLLLNKREEKIMNQDLVKNIKEIGQSLIDNAETIAGNYKYLTDLRITFYPAEKDRAPYYNVESDVIAEGFIERMNNGD